MQEVVVQIPVSFEALIQAIKALTLEDKFRLLDILDQQTADEEADDPEFQARLDAAHAQYVAGKYVTLEELMAELDAED